MNLFEKTIYSYLQWKEKKLKNKLKKHLKRSSVNLTSKHVYSSSATVTLNAETQKNAELARQNAYDIINSVNGDCEKLLSYIENKGTSVIKLANADKILSVIKQEEGLITSLEGLDALYLNIVTKKKISLKSKPIFVMRKGNIDSYYMAHQFYKWYALKMDLPGFDYISQRIFKIYLNSDMQLANLNLDEMIGLKEALNRDKEATEFALSFAREKDGAKKVLEKIKNEGGANI